MAVNRPRVAYFKEFLPTPVCIFLSMCFATVFQFNGGVFLPVAVQMSSELGCIQEDVMMAGYASFIGMTVIFPILFRLKSRFTTRSILLTVCPILIACNWITMHTDILPVLVVTCFISGFFRMWGTFECFSNMRLSVTPSGNFSVFYPFIYIVVLESIQLSGLVAIHLTDWVHWRYMHGFVMFMLAVVWCCVYFLTRRVRVGKKVPLYGIDWIGGILWVVVLFSIVYVCIYGEFYDWLDSVEIRGCIVGYSCCVGECEEDADAAPAIHRDAGVALPAFPDHSFFVPDALSVPGYFLRASGDVHEIHLEVRPAECHFVELVCLFRYLVWSRSGVLSACRSPQGIQVADCDRICVDSCIRILHVLPDSPESEYRKSVSSEFFKRDRAWHSLYRADHLCSQMCSVQAFLSGAVCIEFYPDQYRYTIRDCLVEPLDAETCARQYRSTESEYGPGP